jgi:acetolactate synthase-1/2/3 large subunit
VGYNYKTWAREAFVIVNDIDQEELKKPSIHADMRIHADVKELLTVLEEVLDSEIQTEEQAPLFKGGKGIDGLTWNETCSMWKETYPVVLPKHYEQENNELTNVYAFIKELGNKLNENQITVVGNGSACVVGGHACVIKKGQRFITNSAVASMGYDLPAAIGTCMADSSEDIILITGDGSLQMNIQELQTIIHHKMPIKIFLINNGGYHSIRQTQKNFFGEPLVGVGDDSRDLSFPDMEKLSAAYGYPYVSIHHNSELSQKIEKVLSMEGPVICDIFVSREQNFEPKSSAKRLPDGTMASPPLEDLSPFLSEEEMERNMIIPRLKD